MKSTKLDLTYRAVDITTPTMLVCYGGPCDGQREYYDPVAIPGDRLVWQIDAQQDITGLTGYYVTAARWAHGQFHSLCLLWMP